MQNAKIFIVCVFLVLFIGMGCTDDEPVKVGFLLHSLDKERWENDRDFLREKVMELGGTLRVEVAGNNAGKQLDQARKLLAEGVDILIVVPVDQFAASDIVAAARERKVKVISYDRLILNSRLDYYVSTDNVKIGELQAGYLTTIKPVGNYALIGGAQNDHNSQFLYLGQLNVLQPLIERGDIQLIYNEFTNSWYEEEGYTHTLRILELPEKVNAIIAGNDAIAMGVLKALNDNNIDREILVAGMDADLRNLQEIVKGTQTMTVYKPIEKMAATTAEIALRMANGEEYENTLQTVSNGEMLVPAVLHDAVIVNKENLKLTVISEGYQSEEEVYK
jgi:D-xylose transport system substrate-binding protein